MFVRVARGMEAAHQVIPPQMTVVLPFAADAGAVGGEWCSYRQRGAHLSAMADVIRQRRCNARCLVAVGLLITSTGHAAATDQRTWQDRHNLVAESHVGTRIRRLPC